MQFFLVTKCEFLKTWGFSRGKKNSVSTTVSNKKWIKQQPRWHFLEQMFGFWCETTPHEPAFFFCADEKGNLFQSKMKYF